MNSRRLFAAVVLALLAALVLALPAVPRALSLEELREHPGRCDLADLCIPGAIRGQHERD
jgi:hypothetical protein